jgi:hypothetical protein
MTVNYHSNEFYSIDLWTDRQMANPIEFFKTGTGIWASNILTKFQGKAENILVL